MSTWFAPSFFLPLWIFKSVASLELNEAQIDWGSNQTRLELNKDPKFNPQSKISVWGKSRFTEDRNLPGICKNEGQSPKAPEVLSRKCKAVTFYISI